MALTYPPKVSLAHLPTPFRLLKNYSAQFGDTRIWIKSDEQTGGSLAGNKVRKLEFLLADAQEHNADVIITCGGIQSNHCRATVMAAAQLGLKSHLILRTGDNDGDNQTQDGNWLLDTIGGAAFTYIAKESWSKELNSTFASLTEEYRQQGLTAYSIPTGGSNEVGLWGYISAVSEILEDCKQNQIKPDYIVCATGSAGTQAGLTLGVALKGEDIPVVGIAVCDSNAYFNNKIIRDFEGWKDKYGQLPDDTLKLNPRTIDGYIGPGYAQPYAEVYQTIRALSEQEGVLLDPVYTGKAFYGLTQEIKEGRMQGDIVFVHTGGIFGLFPFKHSFHGSY